MPRNPPLTPNPTQVESLNIESLAGDLEAARKAVEVVEKEAMAQEGYRDALAQLQEGSTKPEALDSEEWASRHREVEQQIEGLKALGLKKQHEAARRELRASVQQREARILLAKSLCVSDHLLGVHFPPLGLLKMILYLF